MALTAGRPAITARVDGEHDAASAAASRLVSVITAALPSAWTVSMSAQRASSSARVPAGRRDARDEQHRREGGPAVRPSPTILVVRRSATSGRSATSVVSSMTFSWRTMNSRPSSSRGPARWGPPHLDRRPGGGCEPHRERAIWPGPRPGPVRARSRASPPRRSAPGRAGAPATDGPVAWSATPPPGRGRSPWPPSGRSSPSGARPSRPRAGRPRRGRRTPHA